LGRIIAIDYGKKRTGLAWTDPLQLIATGIGSFETAGIPERLKRLYEEEPIDAFVLGFPTRLDGSDTDSTEAVRTFATWLRTSFPQAQVHLWDERYTSVQAKDALIRGGAKKKKRRDKHLLNEISATLILQDFLQAGI